MLMESAPSFTASSRAAFRAASLVEPCSSNTFITSSWAWGATPKKSSPLLPATMPATWVPWGWAVE